MGCSAIPILVTGCIGCSAISILVTGCMGCSAIPILVTGFMGCSSIPILVTGCTTDECFNKLRAISLTYVKLQRMHFGGTN